MNEHRYILEPYKGMNTRYRCPYCEANKKFSRYIDTETSEHLHPKVGKCERSDSCGIHYTPKQYFQDNNISFDTPQPKPYHKLKIVTPIPKIISFIPVEVFKASLKNHEVNNFVKFLINLFGVEVTSELISKYFIGTSKHWNGATVFWQIDTQGKVRTGKIILYNSITGKRAKNLELPVYWVHKAIKQPEYELKQCLFGEHLLIDKIKPVAIVESEKTAIIGSVYLPQFIWLAVGSLTNLNAEKCSILKGRAVTLFPDLNGFEKWYTKAKELSHLTIFTVSDLLERKATEAEKKQGLDLADYLIKFDYRVFQLREQPEPQLKVFEQTQLKEIEPVQKLQPVEKINYFTEPETTKPESWEQEINELEKYFKSIALPVTEIKTSEGTITDINKFINCNFTTAKAQNGKRTFLPYINRLIELKKILTISLN